MSSMNGLDQPAAHRFFSSHCFNQAWDLIDQQNRSPLDDVTMLLRSAASVWHWTQRADCTGRNLSIGYWQMARVLAISGHGTLARQFAQLALDAAPADDAFCRSYAFEALARAASVANDSSATAECLNEARSLAALVTDEQDRDLILTDLKSIEQSRVTA